MFQVTPNTETFQARYVITHPATGDFNCDAGRKYLVDLKKRRRNELKELTALTGKNISNWQDDAMATEEEKNMAGADYASLMPDVKKDIEKGNNSPTGIILLSTLLIGGAGFMRWKGIV